MVNPLDQLQFVVLDTELTGLNPKKDSILSLGAIQMDGGQIRLGDTFESLVRPKNDISPKSVTIHQIVPSEVLLQNDISLVLENFSKFCGDRILVGHFIAIDLTFLEKESKSFQKRQALDTVSLLRWLKRYHKKASSLGRDPNYNLYLLAREFEIQVAATHNALSDAFVTAQIFQRFLPLLMEAGITDLKELSRVGAPFQGGEEPAASGTFNSF